MPMLLAGELRHIITITLQTKTGQGDRGQDVYDTTTVGTVPAKIEPLSGRKLELARQLVSTATHEITIRYLSGVVPECQVTYGSRTFNVGAVRNLMETSFAMVLTVTEQQ
jgi:SPP1 family predicted phage head-tail adaptor